MILSGGFDEYSHYEPNFVHISETISCFKKHIVTDIGQNVTKNSVSD